MTDQIESRFSVRRIQNDVVRIVDRVGPSYVSEFYWTLLEMTESNLLDLARQLLPSGSVVIDRETAIIAAGACAELADMDPDVFSRLDLDKDDYAGARDALKNALLTDALGEEGGDGE